MITGLSQQSIIIICVITGLLFLFMIFALMIKSEQIAQLRRSLLKLKHSFLELDEQAKLIVKTDLELNKAQEELDKRLSSLDALQKTSRLISTSLDENEIFARLDQALMDDLGFEKSMILTYGESKILKNRVNFGFSEEEINIILSNLENNEMFINTLHDSSTFSSVNSATEIRKLINGLFNVEHFIISPILTQNGMVGIVFVGNRSNALVITAGDAELLSILANQIGQSLENARLFEQVFSSSQALETKVQDRTKQLASALEEVQKISKTKSEFISAVSHELRTPLTSIKGYASILMTGKLGEIPEAVKDRLGKINMHSDNLVKLINDLLDISRIESGRVEMSFGKCNLTKIIENVGDLLTPQMKEKNIHWITEISSLVPEMYLDASQVERVFINLVGNAVKFTPEHGSITIRANVKDKIVNIDVADTGIGLSQESIEKLFEEFYRVDNQINQNVKGTGLGLPLAKKIVEAHDGKIWITSILNEGTTFHFTLPVKTQEQIKNESKENS